MKISIMERLILLNILPTESTFANMLILKELRDEIGFSESDHERYKIKEDGGGITWDDSVEELKEVVVGEVAYNLIKAAFEKLSADRKITAELMPAYQRFVIDEVEITTL